MAVSVVMVVLVDIEMADDLNMDYYSMMEGKPEGYLDDDQYALIIFVVG